MSVTRPPQLKTVVESAEYEKAKTELTKKLGTNAQIFDDFQQTFDMVLAAMPGKYPRVLPNLKVRMLKTRSGILPAMRIWYVENPEEIELLYIALETDGDDNDEEEE